MLEKRKILFIAANPNTFDNVTWEDEYNAVDHILATHKLDKKYDLKCVPKTTATTFHRRVRGQIWMIHFCGHGTSNRVILETEEGSALPARANSVIQYLADVQGLKCVLFSACDTDKIAEKIQDIVDYSIGFKGTVYNEDTIEFFKCFYESFADFETIPMAFRSVYKKLALENNEKLQVVFKCRNSIIMEVITTGKLPKNWQLQQNLALKERFEGDILQIEQQILVLKKKVAKGQVTIQKLFWELLKDCPSTSIRGILWFEENKELLSKQLAEIIIPLESETRKRYFSEDINIIFIALSISLVTLTAKMEENDFLEYMRFEKETYEKALDRLIELVPDEYSTDFLPYLRDNIRLTQALLQSPMVN